MAERTRVAGNAAIRRATLAAHKAVEQLDAEAIRELERIYTDAARDLSDRIRAHAGADGNLALQEMRSALAQVEQRLRDLGRARDALLDANLSRAATLGVRPFDAAAGIQGGLTTSAGMRVSDDAVNFVRTFVAEDGLQLSDRIWRLDRGARDTVVNAIERAVIQGHGASQAAIELLSRGQGVPRDVQGKRNAANAAALGKTVENALLTGDGAPVNNAMRLMRTEINRAHGEAYMMSGAEHPDFAGWRYLLSPAHPKPDICDLLSTQNLYGLGPGVYPDRARTPWPAHPNTLSFVVIVFQDEISDADRAGKETPLQALERLTPAQQVGVLGKHKHQAFKDGSLKQGMIRAPWRAVKLRVGNLKVRTPLAREIRPPIARTRSVADALAAVKRLAVNVDLPRATVAQLRSLGGGIEAVLGPHGQKLGALSWAPPRTNYLGAYMHYSFGHAPGVNDRMAFRRSYVAGAARRESEMRALFAAQRHREIEGLESLVRGATGPVRLRHETELAIVRAMGRWGVSNDAKDPLFAVAAHEAGHALYFSRGAIGRTWYEQLDRLAVSRLDMARVSRYAMTNREELFAEVTALIADGRGAEVPERIRAAYDAAVKG